MGSMFNVVVVVVAKGKAWLEKRHGRRGQGTVVGEARQEARHGRQGQIIVGDYRRGRRGRGTDRWGYGTVAGFRPVRLN